MDQIKSFTRKLTIHYALIQGFFWISFCSILGFAAIFLQWKQFSTGQVGIILSLSSVCSVILQPIIADFADKTTKISVKNITSLVMLTNFMLGILLFVLPYSLIVTACLFIMICSILFSLSPLLNSVALEYMNKGIHLNYGLARGIGSISFAIMSYFLGFMIDAKGAMILLPLFLISSLGLTMATFTFKLSPKSKNQLINAQILLHNSVPQKKLPKGNLLSFFLQYKKFTIHLIGIILLFTCHSMINTYLIQILEQVGGSSKHLGISLFIAASLELPTMAIYVILAKKIKSGILLKVAAFFLTIKAGILIFAFNVPTVYVSQAFQLISYALFIPASVDYANKIMTEEDKIKGQAFVGVATMGVSGILGNLIAGQIISNAGVTYMVITSAIISAIGFIILFFSTENSY